MAGIDDGRKSIGSQQNVYDSDSKSLLYLNAAQANLIAKRDLQQKEFIDCVWM